MMAISVMLGSIQPMNVSANEGHAECNHFASESIVMMGHNCNDYFDVHQNYQLGVPVGTASTCTMDVYWYDWVCTYPGCSVIERHDYRYQYNSNHKYEQSNGYNRCKICGHSYK